MATFGIYQVLDPLYVTPRGSVCSAKIVGGDAAGRIAVKIFNHPKPDPDEPNWEPKYFLDRAQVQRRVAAAGGGHWAPVYALGFTPEGGAYYVTDYHALTAQKMIDGRLPLDAGALHAIVSSVLSGLEELRRIANRAHANIKASNVLLVGKGPADELRAVLSDPGQDYKAQKEGEAGDLHAVGALIYELVHHRPPVNGDQPAAGEAAWERLGDKAEAWRQLCADLLAHPITPRVATIDGAAKAVDGLAPPRLKVPHLRLPGAGRGRRAVTDKPPRAARAAKPRTPRAPSRFKRRVVQLAALVFLIGGGLAALSLLEARARDELCGAREGWYGSLASSLAEPERRERFLADAHLRRVAEGVDEIERADVPCLSARPKFLGFLDFNRTRAAVASLHRVERELAPESWPQLAGMRDMARTFEKRGWQQPAGYVTQLLEGVRPTPAVSTAIARPLAVPDAPLPDGGTLASRIERVLRLAPIIEQQAAASHDNWEKLDELAASLESSQDSLVSGFGALLRRKSVEAVKLTDDGFDGLTQVEQNAGLAGQVLEQLRTGPPGVVDTARFAREVSHAMRPSELELADVRRWLEERPHYVVRRERIAEAVEDLRKRFDSTANEVSKSIPDPGEAAAFKLEMQGVEAALADFRRTPFIDRDVAQGDFGAKIAQIQDQIEGLKRYYHAEDAADWLANLAGIATNSKRLKSFWDAWVTTLRSDAKAMADDRALFTRNKSRTDKLRDMLTELELVLPQPPADLSDEFAEAATQRRDERLDEIVRAIELSDPALKPEAMKASARSLAAWFDNLVNLNKDFPVRKALLTLDDRPDAPWRENAAFWKDPTVQRLIRSDVDRIERLQKLRDAARPALVAAAQDANVRPEVMVAAWWLLGEDRVTPEWPGGDKELEAEAELRTRVTAAAAALEPAERGPVDEMLAREGPRRWRRFVESADAESVLAAAVKWRKAFRINHVVLGDMSATARFNVWLFLANEAISSPNSPDDDIQTIIENLHIAARELEDSTDHQQKAARVLDKLARLDVPDPFAEHKNMADVFGLDLPGLNEPMEFRRVEPADGSRPFYLGTREVTLGQFTGAIDGANLWIETRKLPWAYRPGRGDGRRGARVWEWVDSNAPRLGATPLWMTRDEINKHNDFPGDFHPESRFNRNVISPQLGGMPSERQPMQYVSAHAALYYAAALGCRLPTSGEWQAALESTRKTVKSGGWNLRDGSWETFRRHAERAGIAPEHWPDAGAFPGEPLPAGAKPAPGRGASDSAFLFRPAPSNDGAFHDLIGNVAEYVCEVPDAFARHDKRTADDVKRFLMDTSAPSDAVGVVGVIGASAMSPADVPADEPQLVRRPDRGYSDVGLRLAFTAPARSPSERLKWVLAGEGYIFAHTASADTRGR